MDIQSLPYGQLPDGRRVDLYVLGALGNASGVAVRVMTYGSTIVSIRTPDRHGVHRDIVLGFDTLDGYLAPHPYFGATIGRYANRIARGRYTLDGIDYQLACNNGPNHLHGGLAGFDKRLWTASLRSACGTTWLDMNYASADGEEGYPGALHARASYALNDDNELTIEYEARCDRATIVNLTNHAYFNLAGRGDVLDHVFHFPAAYFLPVDETLIPSGEMRPVRGTLMDFTSPSDLRSRLMQRDAQLSIAGGYDHTWMQLPDGGAMHLAAHVHEPRSGRTLSIKTTQPGIQFYSGNQLDSSVAGKSDRHYLKHAGFCLEPQRFPDTPNHAEFPPAVLRPGDVYREISIYRFGVAH
jgi:aldose 1-epimerase